MLGKTQPIDSSILAIDLNLLLKTLLKTKNKVHFVPSGLILPHYRKSCLGSYWNVLLLLSFEHPCSDSTLVLTKEAFFTEQLAIKARLFSPLPSKSWLILVVVLYGTSLHHVYVVIVSNISLSNHVHSKMGNRKQVLTKLSCLSRFTTSKPINIFL